MIIFAIYVRSVPPKTIPRPITQQPLFQEPDQKITVVPRDTVVTGADEGLSKVQETEGGDNIMAERAAEETIEL
jgi:hypothetical protein